LIPFSAHAKLSYTQIRYQEGDCLVFGNESAGLPAFILRDEPMHPPVLIPMLTSNVRSLNLATAVGIGLYEALRQTAGI
jgi:tRNA (cytidine/uridine-2'-O-)-methyltransferase